MNEDLKTILQIAGGIVFLLAQPVLMWWIPERRKKLHANFPNMSADELRVLAAKRPLLHCIRAVEELKSLGEDTGFALRLLLELARATDSDFAVVKNLVPYYIYDMSEFMGWEPNAEGRYDGCDDLRHYWEKPDHHPYLIRVDGSRAVLSIGSWDVCVPRAHMVSPEEVGVVAAGSKFP